MLKKTIMILLIPLLCGAAYGHQNARQDDVGGSAQELRQGGPPEDSTAVFVALPFLDGTEGVFEVEVEVYINGTRTFFETMTAESRLKSPGPTVLSLLASAPKMRERLRSLVENGEIQVDFRVVVAEWDSLWVSLGDLMEGSQDLLSQEVRPLDLRFDVAPVTAAEEASSSAPADAGTTPAGGLSCERKCELQYMVCLNRNGCQIPVQGGPEAGSGACSACEINHYSCLAACEPPPPSCPTVTEFVTSSLISVYDVGPLCFQDIFNPSEGELYLERHSLYESRRIRRTVACNGAVTEVVLEVWNFAHICQSPYFHLPCSFPIGYPYNVCY